MKHKFAILPSTVIDRDKYERAQRSLAVARKELRLPPVSIVWFCPEAEAEWRYGVKNAKVFTWEAEPGAILNGIYNLPEYSDPNVIFISASLDYDLSEAVYHETYHLYQQRQEGLVPNREAYELFASEYGRKKAQEALLFGEDKNAFLEHLGGKDWSEPPATNAAGKGERKTPTANSESNKRREIHKSANKINTVSKAFARADANADIDLVNKYSVSKLKPEDVFCFSVVLCDNDVDRDFERFTDRTLDKFASLFVGKTGITDHNWSAERQLARLYRTSVDITGEHNQLGEPLKRLIGSAYMMKNETNQPIIDAICGGILKEVSIGAAMGACNCSICRKPLTYDWRSGVDKCEAGHIKGQKFDGKLCVGELDDPKDAYEFSFVAVPSQRGAGVTKGQGTGPQGFDALPAVEREYRLKLIAEMKGEMK